jgi:amino acid transporter
VRNPKRDIPVALLLGIAVVMLVYVLIQVVCIGTLPGLAASERPLADAASQFMGGAGAALISAGAIISITGNLNVIVLAASRLPFAMSERGQLPRSLSLIHGKFHTPHVSIVVSAGLALALTLSRSFTAALTISTIARLVTYAVTCASLPVLRRKEGAIDVGFKAPLGSLVSAVVLLLSIWLLSNSNPREARDSAAAALLGLLVYISYRLWLRLERRTAALRRL